MVGNIIIDNDTVNINIDNVSFTLNWDEPFANFDPIVNYTVTINCTHASCPVILTVTTTSASVNFITNLSMITPLSVIASNTVGTSDPTTIIITGKIVLYVHMYVLICVQTYIRMYSGPSLIQTSSIWPLGLSGLGDNFSVRMFC